MKKISTLLIAITLFCIGASAQGRRYNNDNGYNGPYRQQTYGDSRQNRYDNDWNDRRGRNDRHWRRNERFEEKHFRNDCVNDGVSNDVIYRDRIYHNDYDRYDYPARRQSGLRIVIGGVLRF